MSSSSCLGSGTQYNGPTCDTTLCVLSVAFYCCADISIKRPWYNILNGSYCIMNVIPGNTEGGSITVLLTSCWFGISCMTTNNFCFYLQNRLIQTSQTGGQQYSDTPISIPWYTVSSSSSPYSCLLTSTVTLSIMGLLVTQHCVFWLLHFIVMLIFFIKWQTCAAVVLNFSRPFSSLLIFASTWANVIKLCTAVIYQYSE
jgi:hypothetical protein